MNAKLNKLTKIVAYSFLSIVALVALLVGIAFSPLGVQFLINTVNDQPGINVEYDAGSLYSKLRLRGIEYNHKQMLFIGKNLTLDVGINCLFVGQACVEQLSIDSFELTLKQNDIPSDAATEPLSDYIELPLLASLQQFQINRLLINQQSQSGELAPLLMLKNLDASLQMHTSLDLHYLSLQEGIFYSTKRPSTHSASEMPPSQTQIITSDSASFAEILAQIKAFQYKPIALPEVFVPINASLNKVDVKLFCVEQSTRICINDSQLNASVLKQSIQMDFNASPVEQVISQLSAKLQLDINKQFAHKLNVELKPNIAKTASGTLPIVFSLVGDISQTELLLSQKSHNDTLISVQSIAALQDVQLPVNINLSAKNYLPVLKNWLPSLVLPIAQVDIAITGNTQSYSLISNIQLVGEQATEFSAQMDMSIKQKSIEIKELKTTGDLGELSGQAALVLSEIDQQTAIVANANLRFDQLSTAPIMPSAPVRLNGAFTSDLNITHSAFWGDFSCEDIQSNLSGVELSLLCDISFTKDGVMTVNNLAITQGQNSLQAVGSVDLGVKLDTNVWLSNIQTNNNAVPRFSDTTSELNINLDLPNINSIYPAAQGRAIGTVSFKGNINQPLLNANINVNKLVFDNIQLGKVDVLANVDASKNWQTDLNLLVENFSLKDANTDNFEHARLLAQRANIIIQGDAQDHLADIVFLHPDYSTQHQIKGALTIPGKLTSQIEKWQWQWQGQWLNGQVSTPFDTFALNQPTTISLTQVSREFNALLAAHCWVDINSINNKFVDNNAHRGLCVNKAEYANSITNLDATIQYDFNSALLYLLPEMFVDGTSVPVTSTVRLSHSAEQGLNVTAYQLISGAKVLTNNHEIDFNAIVANLELQNDILQSNIFAGTEETGAVGFSSVLILSPANRTHRGQLTINNVNLAPFQRFIPTVEDLSGLLEGTISFAGSLTQPNLNGNLYLSDGQMNVDNYPYPISNFNQQIDIVNNVAQIIGDFELGAGNAEYSARVDFADKLDMQGTLLGSGMQLAFGKHEVLASPNISFALNPERLKLNGDIIIPNAQINIKELPASAKAASTDTLIIGQEPPPPVVPIGLDIDLRIVLDPPKLKRVTVNALDLSASLGGDLQVKVIQKSSREKAQDKVSFAPLETYMYGSVDILTGSYEAYGQNLQIKNGAIFFSGLPNLPQFDITAIRNPLNTADNVVAGLRITGNPVIPKVELFSEPAMSQALQLSYLLYGTRLDAEGEDSNNVLLVNALVSFGIGNSENGVNRLGKSLGFESLNLQTSGQGDSTQVQLTGRISDNIQITYGVGLFDQASEVILKYQFLPKLYLEAKSGATSAVDLFYEWTRSESHADQIAETQ